MTEATGSRKDTRDLAGVPNAELGRTIKGESGIDKERRDAAKAKGGFYSRKGDGVKGFGPIEKQDMKRVLLSFINLKDPTLVERFARIPN